jgi:hypothetical protein
VIVLMPLATVLIINAAPAPWETGNVFADAAVAPIVACVDGVGCDAAAPRATAFAATIGLPGPP